MNFKSAAFKIITDDKKSTDKTPKASSPASTANKKTVAPTIKVKRFSKAAIVLHAAAKEKHNMKRLEIGASTSSAHSQRKGAGKSHGMEFEWDNDSVERHLLQPVVLTESQKSPNSQSGQNGVMQMLTKRNGMLQRRKIRKGNPLLWPMLILMTQMVKLKCPLL